LNDNNDDDNDNDIDAAAIFEEAKLKCFDG
jgi:hypothetical protein